MPSMKRVSRANTGPRSRRAIEAKRQELRQRHAARAKARLALNKARTPIQRTRARAKLNPLLHRRRLDAARASRASSYKSQEKARVKKPRVKRVIRAPRRQTRRVSPPRERFRLFKHGIRMVPKGLARGMRVAAPHLKQGAAGLARWGADTVSRLGGTTLHYGGEILRTGGEEAISSGGELAGQALRNTGEALRRVGGTTISETGNAIGTVGEAGLRGGSGLVKTIGTQAIESGSELGARLGTATMRETSRVAGAIGEAGLGLAATGIEAGAAATTRLAQGVLLRLPRWAARRTLDFIASKRALKRVVNPNLAGKWKLLFRKEGTPVTEDGFVVHTIQSRPFRVGKKQRKAIHVNVEYGFSEDGRFIVRVEPVLDGASHEEDELIQRLYQKHFKSVRRGARSLTRRLGGARGIRNIRERYLSEKAFPREAYAEPETTVVEPEGPVPEDAVVGVGAPEPAPA